MLASTPQWIRDQQEESRKRVKEVAKIQREIDMPKDKASEAEILEKVLADYRELCKDVDCIDMAQGLIEAFVSQQRKQAAEEAIKAVTPEDCPLEQDDDLFLETGWNACRSEVIRRGQDHLTKM